MRPQTKSCPSEVRVHRRSGTLCLIAAFVLLAIPALRAHAQVAATASAAAEQAATDPYGDAEDYRFRIGGQFWYATPTGQFAGSTTQAPISFTRDLNFQSYSTGTGGVDWHFARKHHLFFLINPNQISRTVVLDRTIMFRDYTFMVGATVKGSVTTNVYAPGYRWDFLHRKKGHLGIVAQLNILDIRAAITGMVVTTGGSSVATASGSLISPIPVFGPDGRFYFAKQRMFFDGNVKGMYFFGYGNYITAATTLGVRVTPHFDLLAGYQMGSHLAINADSMNAASSRLSFRETQYGFTTGLEFNFGKK